MAAWIDDLRAIHDAAFRDWRPHVADLNASLGLTGDHAFATTNADGLLAWFNGDVERIEPGRWTLVVSLNPQLPKWDYGAGHTPSTWWDLWRTKNERYWRPSFFGPLARLAAHALGDDLPTTDEPAYATNRMVFVELSPYPSRKFALARDAVARLACTDGGFRIGGDVRRLLIERAGPALVLVNGKRAVEDFELAAGMALRWRRVEYPSVANPSKRLWHREGTYESNGRRVPVAGFPFLNSMGGFNGRAELQQLAERLRAAHGTSPLRNA